MYAGDKRSLKLFVRVSTKLLCSDTLTQDRPGLNVVVSLLLHLYRLCIHNGLPGSVLDTLHSVINIHIGSTHIQRLLRNCVLD